MSMFASGAASQGSDFDILAYAASGMEAQRGALEVAAHNIALSQTATPDHPVKAYAPVFSSSDNAMSGGAFASLVRSASSDDDDDNDTDSSDDSSGSSSALSAIGGNGTQGLVAMTGMKMTNTDINPISQMMDLINAQRAYESNASVFDLGKTLASKTIDLENSN
jgi:flagellar basal body rod protein FlgC